MPNYTIQRIHPNLIGSIYNHGKTTEQSSWRCHTWKTKKSGETGLSGSQGDHWKTYWQPRKWTETSSLGEKLAALKDQCPPRRGSEKRWPAKVFRQESGTTINSHQRRNPWPPLLLTVTGESLLPFDGNWWSSINQKGRPCAFFPKKLRHGAWQRNWSVCHR